MKRLKVRLSVDTVILTTASFVFATSLFFLFQDGAMLDGGDRSNLTAVGTFKISSNDVRRRLDSGMTWSNIDAPDKVYEGDTIFTGDKSEASVTLSNGNVIKIDAKSLVVIRTKGNKTEIDLQYGSLQGKIESADPIVITQNGKQQELGGSNGSQIRIVKTEKAKTVRVQVTKGEVTVKQKDKPNEIVKQDETVQIHETTAPVVEKASVVLLTPVDGQSQWLAMGAPLKFAWRSTGAAKAGRSRLEFSRDGQFETPTYSAEVSGDAYSVADTNVPQGSFYWRVKPASGEPSLPANASVYADVPPMPVLPKDAQVYLLDSQSNETTKAVYFTWEDKSNSTEYEFQLARDKEFSAVLQSKKGKEKVQRIVDLAVGEYYWRVVGRHPKRLSAPWSRTMAFSIREGAKAPKAPVVASSELNYTIPNSLLSRVPASVLSSGRGVKPEGLTPFKWTGDENAQSYEVEVGVDASFANSVRYDAEGATSFAPQEVRPGALYMRVRAKSADGRVSPVSTVTKLNVALQAPQLEKIKPVTSVFKSADELQKATHDFRLAWTPQPFADAYELQWGVDAEFTKSKKFKVKETSRELKVSKAQSYAARVRSLDASGNPISGYSSVEFANYKKDLVLPKPVAKLPVKIVEAPRAPAAERDDRLGGMVLTIPVPQLKEPAVATALISLEDAPTFVTFKWKAYKNATFYTIQISEDADFTKVVSETESKSPAYVFQKALPEGKVFWRVRAHMKSGFSQWSDPYDINVIYQ